MIVIPAIDLMGGKCVRLIQGNRENVISYDKTPMEVAEEYERLGTKLIHVVDLDGAFTGEMKNLEIIRNLAKRFTIQVGGGVRSEDAIKTLVDLNVKRVIASTILLKDQKLATALKKKYYGTLIGSFDFKDGKLSYSGWTKQSQLNFEDVAKDLSEVVVTDVSRDGTFKGPNIELLKSLMKTCNAKIISAGGVLDMLDLFELKNIGVYGAIVGRAFLENRLNLRDSFRMTELGGTTVNEAK